MDSKPLGGTGVLGCVFFSRFSYPSKPHPPTSLKERVRENVVWNKVLKQNQLVVVGLGLQRDKTVSSIDKLFKNLYYRQNGKGVLQNQPHHCQSLSLFSKWGKAHFLLIP